MQTGTQPLDFTLSCRQHRDVTTENDHHDLISETYPIGGGAGINQLCSQGLADVAKIDYARQTSAPTPPLHRPNYVAYARDGITWETFPGVAGSR